MTEIADDTPLRLAEAARRFFPNGGKTRKLQDTLAYPPKAMRADRAAAYLGMSRSSFLKLVDDGIMPKPTRINGMALWDRLALDVAFEALAAEDQDANNSFDKVVADLR
jgi:predicted DNA-binding transcriptional regulator AlpA